MKAEDIEVGQCNYRGSCKNHGDCKRPCGPPEFSHITVGICEAKAPGHGKHCCCIWD